MSAHADSAGRAGSVRTAFVPGARLSGWLERFSAAHGGFRPSDDDDGVRLLTADGTTALLQPPWPADGRPGRGADALERLASIASQPRRLGLLLVRRGGYGVAVASEGVIVASKAGTRYVQSRTAAGGQSQQRFARRRSNQADELVQAVAGQARQVFSGQSFEYVVPGGDRTLVDLVLEEPVLKDYAKLPRLAYLDVPDPRAAVLKKAAADACAVRIQVTDPAS
ncbi:acVLRF1 family peptidyl-tRNA hydrolase [Pseudarthrobacter sp. NPDC055928]|uniref:acVLRF1 family peptidyl-tRNA hydrolase n=1 Tax=unclassified Pseudarthrobacter TaxID=2647000 RepID=UPI00307862C6